MEQKYSKPEFKKKKMTIEKPFTKHWFKNMLFVVTGSFLISFGFVFFMVPFNIVPGGIFGLSLIINSLTGLPIGGVALFINIPLLLMAVKLLGGNFSLKTIISMGITSFFIDYFIFLYNKIPLTHDMFVSVIFGGVLMGSGVAIIIRGEATSGGSDLIARMISKLTRRPIGQMLLLVDGTIVLTGFFVFKSIEIIPYAIIAIFILSKTVDTLLTGFDNKKAVFIISDKHEAIRNIILNELDRGGTYLLGKGLFFKEQEKKIIFTALTRREMAALQMHIKKIDPEAFLTVVDTNEIIGSGFKPFH